jgi:hypothetical protein
MKILSGIAERVIFTRWVNFDDYFDLRGRFLEIYENCAEMEPLQEHYEKQGISDIKKKAIDIGKEANKFEPHSIVFDPLNSFKRIFQAVQIIVLIFGLILWILGFVTVDLLSRLISVPSLGEVLINYGIPVTWMVFALAYLEALRKDRWFLRKMNERLKIDQDTIDKESEKSKLISYLLWNSGLTRNTTIPVLAFLTVIRGISKEMVDEGLRFANLTLVYHLEEDMTQIEALGAAFSHLFYENPDE